MARHVYLDFNATAPVKPAVADAVAAALAAGGNPSSVHAAGRRARALVEAAREQVAMLVGAQPADVVFTSGGTEANDLALAAANGPVAASAVEHDSVIAGAAVRVPVDGSGRLRLDALAEVIERERPALVAVMLANNETGVIQPVAEAAALARASGARLLCDAIQGAGKLPIDIAALGADYLSLSAHKIGGPTGAGALVMRPGAPLPPRLRGGGQERGRRAGTENVPGIAGFGAAARLARADLEDQPRIAALRDRLEAALAALAPEGPVYGGNAPRLANTTCVGMPGVRSETQVMAFDLAGFAVSAGAACSSGKVAASHVLEAMGVPAEAAGCAIRVSLGWSTTADEIDRFVAAWSDLYRRTRARAA